MCKGKGAHGTSTPGCGEAIVAGGSTIAFADAVVAEPLVDVSEKVKRTSDLWHIHGKYFDLSGFLRQHPGGSGILEAARGKEDVTPLFESYHAMANMSAILGSMEKFEWKGKLIRDTEQRDLKIMSGRPKEPVRYRYKAGGFYDVVKTRVKRHILEKHGFGGVDPAKASVNRFIKLVMTNLDVTMLPVAAQAPGLWYVKVVLIVTAYVLLWACLLGVEFLGFGGFFSSGWTRAGAAFLAGTLLQSFSFCTLHDASHYGLFFKKPKLQDVVSRVCNAWTLWHHGLWVMHHVYGHHSFTGDHERDPDVIHAQPWIRKSVHQPKEDYAWWSIRWQRFHLPVFFMMLPGATLGQTYAYSEAVFVKGSLWRIHLSRETLSTRWYEYLTYALAIGLHVWAGSLLVTFCYFMGVSVSYHLCIAPDHETFESAVVNCIERKHEKSGRPRLGDGKTTDGTSNGGTREEVSKPPPPAAVDTRTNGGAAVEESARGQSSGDHPLSEGQPGDEGDDWGEVQVRHSGNFSTKNALVTQFMGGINFQIEHHLFPSMSHMHYKEIAPIVRDTCREFSIPYNNHPSVWSAYKSYMKHMVLCSRDFGMPDLGKC